ncbi:hypothetical protein [Paramaledivibacter caminithermalis]|uniref:Uncharacterized protein n=1 Tax=Paramaledivibacter caminithermalis (strain DSM 15212 / CIP 107654 / DViRD3) TaxID=1121301 RepID=A0A1M6JN43_PARC5|nr:hypothetical protein [Paramaledivibacter caminithermalis]SHJ48082.1 hypothetical protein SAMN02745912_00056 [Paramaledivibacter caminithermalis DSM 15212]
MKRFVCCIMIFTLLFAMSTTVFAEQNKEAELKNIINWAKNKGFEIDGDISNIDYANLDINKLKKDLEAISSLGKELYFEKSNFPQEKKFDKLSIKPIIGIRSFDEKIVPMIVKKTYKGTTDIDGENYNFKIYVYIDYNCLVDRNGKILGIDSINNVTSDAGQASFIRDYEHDTGTEVWSISGKKANVRGQGVFSLGVTDKLAFKWRVMFKVSFKAGEGKPIY